MTLTAASLHLLARLAQLGRASRLQREGRKFESCTGHMKHHEKRVLELLDGGYSYEQIARIFNVTPERVRLVEKQARAKLHL